VQASHSNARKRRLSKPGARPLSGRVPPLSSRLVPSFTYNIHKFMWRPPQNALGGRSHRTSRAVPADTRSDAVPARKRSSTRHENHLAISMIDAGRDRRFCAAAMVHGHTSRASRSRLAPNARRCLPTRVCVGVKRWLVRSCGWANHVSHRLRLERYSVLSLSRDARGALACSLFDVCVCPVRFPYVARRRGAYATAATRCF
jgi:hypothetical protein